MAKISILGLEGAGKSVFFAVSVELFREIRSERPHIVCNTNFPARIADILAQGRFPNADESYSDFRALATLYTPDGSAHGIKCMDACGEDVRAVFSVENGDGLTSEQKYWVKWCGASDCVVLLINLATLETAPDYTSRAEQELLMLALMRKVFASGVRCCVLLTQLDRLIPCLREGIIHIEKPLAEEAEAQTPLDVVKKIFPSAYALLKTQLDKGGNRFYLNFVAAAYGGDRQKDEGTRRRSLPPSYGVEEAWKWIANAAAAADAERKGTHFFRKKPCRSFVLANLQTLLPNEKKKASSEKKSRSILSLFLLLGLTVLCLLLWFGVVLLNWLGNDSSDSKGRRSDSSTSDTNRVGNNPSDDKTSETLKREFSRDWMIADLSGCVKLELLLIPAGTFTMGSPSYEEGRGFDENQASVRLTKPFYLGKTEVTQAQWKAVMGNNPSYFNGDNLPVVKVSWDDAMAFCSKLTERERAAGRLPRGWKYTLPTEAQWEYACRAGTTTRFVSGSSEPALREVAWWGENSEYNTHPVAQKKPNAWGLYDMHGNVWEWCLDYYNPSLAGGNDSVRTTPGSGNYGFDRVNRGGSWCSRARYCRSAARLFNSPGIRLYNLGFRVAAVQE